MLTKVYSESETNSVGEEGKEAQSERREKVPNIINHHLTITAVTLNASIVSAQTINAPITLSKSSGSVGDTLQITCPKGTFVGFTGHNYVEVTFDGELRATITPELDGRIRTDSSGNLVSIPASSFGPHTITATQYNEYSTYEGSETFTVTGVQAVTITQVTVVQPQLPRYSTTKTLQAQAKPTR